MGGAYAQGGDRNCGILLNIKIEGVAFTVGNLQSLELHTLACIAPFTLVKLRIQHSKPNPTKYVAWKSQSLLKLSHRPPLYCTTDFIPRLSCYIPHILPCIQ